MSIVIKVSIKFNINIIENILTCKLNLNVGQTLCFQCERKIFRFVLALIRGLSLCSSFGSRRSTESGPPKDLLNEYKVIHPLCETCKSKKAVPREFSSEKAIFKERGRV